MKSTIGSRSTLLLALLWCAPSAAGAEPATLEDLFARVDDDRLIAISGEAEAEAQEQLAALHMRWSGPDISAGARVIPSGEQELEVTLGQEMPLGGARKGRRDAGVATAAALRADAKVTVVELKAAIANRFYNAVHQQERVKALGELHAAATRAHTALVRREAAGDASAFEVERMGRQVRRMALGLQRERIALTASLDGLATLADVSNLSAADGVLAPAACGGEPAVAPRSEAFAHRLEAAESARQSARSGSAPSLHTELGWAGIAGDNGLAQGFIVGVGLSFPFWAYGGFADRSGAARVDALTARKALYERQTARRLEAWTQRCRDLTELGAAAKTGVAQSEQLLIRAEAGYAAAELSLLELVDAQAALLEDRLEHLELLSQARAAQNEWMRLTGGWK